MTAVSMEEAQKSELPRVFIPLDSQAALNTICKPRASSALIEEYGDALERLSEIKEISLVWIWAPRDTRQRDSE